MPALATAGTVIYSLTCEGLAGSQRSDASITVTQGDTPVQPVAPTEVQDVGGGATLPAGLAGLALLALLRRRPGRHACRT
jgi:MYXO-CTERM domain-containing protein